MFCLQTLLEYILSLLQKLIIRINHFTIIYEYLLLVSISPVHIFSSFVRTNFSYTRVLFIFQNLYIYIQIFCKNIIISQSTMMPSTNLLNLNLVIQFRKTSQILYSLSITQKSLIGNILVLLKSLDKLNYKYMNINPCEEKKMLPNF